MIRTKKGGEMKMKEKIAILLTALGWAFLFGWGLNRTLSYYDPPEKVKWVEYEVPKDMYLWRVASELSNQFRKHPQVLVKIISEKNNINDNDYYLLKGRIILIPSK